MHFQLTMVWNREELYHHCFSTLFGISHYNGPIKLWGNGIEWDISASALCWWCSFNLKKHKCLLFIPVAPTLEHRASVKHFVSLQFLNLRHSVGLLGRVISPSQGYYLTPTQNKYRHPCLKLDSNPQSQCSREWRQFMCGHCDQKNINNIRKNTGALLDKLLLYITLYKLLL
jgi:hypothetical protein